MLCIQHSGKKNLGFSHISPFIKQTFKLKGMSFAEALWEKKGEGYRRMKKRRSYWFRKREFKVRSNREEEGRETERLSSFQQQQVNLEISCHTSLIVLIMYSSAAYFLVEDLKLLSFLQVWTWRITKAIYILCICITIVKHTCVLTYTYMVSN